MAQRNGTGSKTLRMKNPRSRNPGDVWSIKKKPFSAAHFAVMPAQLAQHCILAGCKPGGIVLDPFSGSGTTGLAAQRTGRKYIGIDLNAEYLELSLTTRDKDPRPLCGHHPSSRSAIDAAQTTETRQRAA
jgi:DNA modification methylase